MNYREANSDAAGEYPARNEIGETAYCVTPPGAWSGGDYKLAHGDEPGTLAAAARGKPGALRHAKRRQERREHQGARRAPAVPAWRDAEGALFPDADGDGADGSRALVLDHAALASLIGFR